MNQFTINGVNGVKDLVVSIDGPGVFVARGPNGAGKSNAIEAIKAANGDKDAKAEPSDGFAKGEVRGASGEVLMAVGNRRKLAGDLPSVRLVSTGAIGRLIDPQIADSETAAKARIKALLTLMPLPADDAARMGLTANDEELQLWIKSDPSKDAAEMAEAVRKRANELANELEKRSAEASGEELSMNALIEGLGQLDFEAGNLKVQETILQQMANAASVKAETAQARLTLERQQEEARKAMGERPDIEKAQADLDAANRSVFEAQAALKVAAAMWEEKGRALNGAKRALMVYAAQTEILRQEIKGATTQEAIEAEQAADAQRGRVERARKVDQAKSFMASAMAAKERREKCADRAVVLRGIAKGTATALGELLARRGLPGLGITEGRLVVLDPAAPGGMKDFDLRLSFGERVRAALGIALAGMTNDQGPMSNDRRLPVMALEPGFWLALDDGHRAEVNRIARERGVCLITEEPGDGELRIERMA